MTTYFVELGFCFQPRQTSFVLENNACLSLDQAGESVQVLAPWTDGTFWLDLDGVTQVGWLEIDGVTHYPPGGSGVALTLPTGAVALAATPVMTASGVLPLTGAAALAADATVAAVASQMADAVTFGGEGVTFNGEAVTFNG